MNELTPMMKQYFEIKEQNPDVILFFRLGDFYEMFYDDAKIASSELDLTLTGKDCGQDERAPMCGIPYHSCEGYIARLINKGFKVAICEQMEDPKTAKGLVKREIIRIITPGTVTDSSMLDEDRNNYIACVYLGEGAGISFIDISTGEAHTTSIKGDDIAQKIVNEIGKFLPREVVLNETAIKEEKIKLFLKEQIRCLVNVVDNEKFQLLKARETVEKQFQDNILTSMGFNGNEEALCSLGALLNYLIDTQKNDLKHINSLNFYELNMYMEIDLTTQRNLELLETMRQKEKRGSLLWVLDKTRTSMGARLLRKWVEQPLINVAYINKRLEAVDKLKSEPILRGELLGVLKEVFDIERLLSRVIYGSANGRDLIALANTLSKMPEIKNILKAFNSSPLDEINRFIDDINELYGLIFSAIVDDPPFSIREGGIIRDGYDEDIDKLNSILRDAKGYILKLESDEKEKTGIRNLKIGYNKVFGYYIEVTRSYLNLVPDTYIRKQTLSNCERYITQELKEFENTVLSANDRIVALEYDVFCSIRDKVASETLRIQRTASGVAQCDALCSLAQAASDYNYCMPHVSYSDVIELKDSRHPVVERMLKDSLFVPNDVYLDNDKNRLAIITGPNMAGKSTYMRQVALIALMAQMGSFVPASKAEIGICDKIFTRVGASDDLAAGQSTFMVEMSEGVGPNNIEKRNEKVACDIRRNRQGHIYL